MKHTLLIATLALAALATSCQTTPKAYDANVEMAKWTEFATPGPAHQALNARVGHWTYTAKMFQPGVAEPMEATGTSDAKWILDGRYMEDTTEGSMMGQPFHGIGTTGYDNLTKHYVFTWIDNMGTGVMTGTGNYDPSKKTFNFETMSPNPMEGEYVSSRSTETWKDNDHFTMRMYMPGPDGKEYMMMQLDYTRAG